MSIGIFQTFVKLLLYISYGYTLLKHHGAVSVGITFTPLEGYHDMLYLWVYQKHEHSFIEYEKMFGFFCAMSWAVLWAVYSVPASSGAFPCPRSVARPVGFYGASVGLPRGQWMKHTRKGLPRPAWHLYSFRGCGCCSVLCASYLWPCSIMGCRKHTEEGPPVAVALPCFPVICQRVSVPSCVKAPALACPGLPLVNRISFT